MTNERLSAATMASVFVLGMSPFAGGKQAIGEDGPPDLTKDESVSDIVDGIVLGATGADGWIWGDRRSTRGAKQIYIVRVEEGAPAEGALQKGDVILGVNGTLFSHDARREFADALTEAERETYYEQSRAKRWVVRAP